MITLCAVELVKASRCPEGWGQANNFRTTYQLQELVYYRAPNSVKGTMAIPTQSQSNLQTPL